MRKRWKQSVGLTCHLGYIFTVIKMIFFPSSPLHLLFAFRHWSPQTQIPPQSSVVTIAAIYVLPLLKRRRHLVF
jgi:hypothetical protein